MYKNAVAKIVKNFVFPNKRKRKICYFFLSTEKPNLPMIFPKL